MRAMSDETVFLYVEDDRNDVELLRTALHGQQVGILRVVPDGQEAIDYLLRADGRDDREKFPLPDVILLDLKMPRMDGFQFLQWLRQDSPNHLRRIPVIVMSTSAEPSDVDRSYDLGANCYLTK